MLGRCNLNFDKHEHYEFLGMLEKVDIVGAGDSSNSILGGNTELDLGHPQLKGLAFDIAWRIVYHWVEHKVYVNT